MNTPFSGHAANDFWQHALTVFDLSKEKFPKTLFAYGKRHMDIKFIKRNFFQRVLGISATAKPEIDDCWHYADGKLTIDLNKAYGLKTPGGALRLEGDNLPKRVLVVLGEDGEYRAFHNRCTHLGHRRLDPVPGTDTVQCCSINKSTYDSSGNKIYGPVHKPITRYPVERDQERLIVSIF